jgi:hypothetical protein
LRNKIKFYALISCELIFLPLLFTYNFFKRFYSVAGRRVWRFRKPVYNSSEIYIQFHEWGGYKSIRQKRLKNSKIFFCGVEYHLNRFNGYDTTLTISDVGLSDDIKALRKKVGAVIEVDNSGMDFSGYSAFYATIKNKPNAYVILSNSSVNGAQDDFIDSYLDYMQANRDVALLGVSYSTKCFQSLVINNFSPHLQSFFYFTTLDVLNEIVKANGGSFPGEYVDHKLLLIRNGEIKMSKIALKLGYSLAIVQEDGSVFKFNSTTSYRDWTLPRGDYRDYVKNPNKINPIVSILKLNPKMCHSSI